MPQLPETLMDGFPPSPASQVTLANWRSAPFCQWAFHHVREIIPSASIPCDPNRRQSFSENAADLSTLSVMASDGEKLDFEAYLEASFTDGIVVIKDGKIALERYFNGMTANDPHILMSVSKSLLGLLAGVLVGDGALKEEALATDYVPEVKGTAYEGATIRDLLDMRVGVDFSEDYEAASGTIIAYRKATNWNPLEPGDTPSDLRSFYQLLLDKDGEHNGRTHYVSPNTDLLAWIFERATGERYVDLMSEKIWRPMGAETDAYLTVDRLGAPRAAGGVCTTTRDLALVGQMVLEGGNGIVPEAWINDIITGGDETAWNAGSFAEYYPGKIMGYRSKWYNYHGDDALTFALGIHGQNLFIDRKRGVVIAKHSSQGAPIDRAINGMTMRMVDRIRKELG